MTALPSDVAALVDPKPGEAARAVHQAACHRIETLKKQLAEADEALAAAITRRGELIGKAIAGETVSPNETREADRRIGEIERHRQFITDTIEHVENSLPELSRAIATSHSESLRPVFREGVRRRFAAAERVSQARAQLYAAEKELAGAQELLEAARVAGFQASLEVVEATRSPMPTMAERAVLARENLLPLDEGRLKVVA